MSALIRQYPVAVSIIVWNAVHIRFKGAFVGMRKRVYIAKATCQNKIKITILLHTVDCVDTVLHWKGWKDLLRPKVYKTK